MKRIITLAITTAIITAVCFTGCATTEKASPVSEPVTAVQNAEYSRSTENVTISFEEFTHDKEVILQMISELDVVMKNQDYKTWITYLDQESINYYSRPVNLQKAAARLPVKNLKLNSLEDYFKFVFIQARIGRRIDEIRYKTKDSVDAVQVKEDGSDIIYYSFAKVNGKWKLHLPPLSD